MIAFSRISHGHNRHTLLHFACGFGVLESAYLSLWLNRSLIILIMENRAKSINIKTPNYQTCNWNALLAFHLWFSNQVRRSFSRWWASANVKIPIHIRTTKHWNAAKHLRFKKIPHRRAHILFQRSGAVPMHEVNSRTCCTRHCRYIWCKTNNFFCMCRAQFYTLHNPFYPTPCYQITHSARNYRW